MKKEKQIIKVGSIKEWEQNLNETKSKNPNSFGILNAFNGGFMKNKPNEFKTWNYYWVLDIVAMSGKVLDKNLHPNIIIEVNDQFIGLHMSSDAKAFPVNLVSKQLGKEYYIAMDRIYLFSKEFAKNFIVQDMNKTSVSTELKTKIIEHFNLEKELPGIALNYNNESIEWEMNPRKIKVEGEKWVIY